MRLNILKMLNELKIESDNALFPIIIRLFLYLLFKTRRGGRGHRHGAAENLRADRDVQGSRRQARKKNYL